MADEPIKDRRESYALGYSDQAHQWMSRRTAEEYADFFLPHLRSGMRLLDVGSGPGTITLDLAQAVAPGEVVGIDIEPQQVERARALAVERGAQNAQFEVGDAYALPFPDGSFDAVFAHAVLIHLHDPLAALREFRRVLRPGGVAGVSDGAFPWFLGPATPLLQEWAMLFHRFVEYTRGRSTSVLDFAQRRLLLDAGFARTEAHAQVRNGGLAETVRNLGEASTGNSFRRVALEHGWADDERLRAMLAELRAWPEREDAFGCWIWCSAVGWVDG